ncbi:MAG TPA: T9SS type A sorting domain-containing protein, partial [Saprospiraceae bacterium]|nr:T9SS type A sorting domain-containing protein [Saprospiraceae bacterium]
IHAENGIPPYEYSLNGSIFISDNTFTDLAAGSYDYQVKDLTNTIIDGTVTVTEPDSLILDIIKAGYNLTLSISGGVPPFLASIDGVNFSETLNFTNLSMGNYLVSVKDANDCVVSDTVSILTSVNNVDHAGLSIFPLPADAKLNIQLKNIQVRNISITDVMGRRQQENLHKYTISDKILINTSSLPSGMYILMIETDDTLYSTKLIIQH